MPEARRGGPWQRGAPADDGVERTFPLHPRSVPLARHAARETFREWPVADAADTAELAVSELFGNAVRAAVGPAATLRMWWSPRRLRVEVWDASPQRPALREAAETDEGGRGLWLIQQTAVRWGTETLPEGKCVWAEFALPAAA